ncbi:MAG: AI-2E family transporter [Kiritimatiellaeota bacterium]|nr:AI-2E family transporter [Kiritimatiellota bacterium]
MLEGSGVKRFFAHNWEKLVLWTILIGLFYLLRPFFLLIFLTFLITYLTKTGIDWVVRRLNMNYRWATIVVFVLFLSLLGSVGAWMGPKLVIQSNQILTEIAGDSEKQAQEKINRFADKIVVRIVGQEKGREFIGSEEYAALMTTLKDEAIRAIKTALPNVLQTLLNLVKLGWKLFISLLLAIIFSFALVLDWRRIAARMRALETSRIGTFYQHVAPHLQAFAVVLGKAFRAQAIIATCNTILTAAGLWYFNVPNIALLSAIVFLCGFIPILGTFLSSIPILLFGIQHGGLDLMIKLVALIALVHAFEAYLLNPKITADVLHVHPLLILVLLLLGERFFGIWGMVVGVPIGYYVITVLTKKDDHLAAEAPQRPPP